MFNNSFNHNQALAKKALAACSLITIVLTSTIAQATTPIVVKGPKCHPSSPVGFCCPNDGRPSGPYCPDRRLTTNTQN